MASPSTQAFSCLRHDCLRQVFDERTVTARTAIAIQPMPKLIFDLIQRFEVESGVPHLVSTSIQTIQGGEDLMSLAISRLTQLGFDRIFEEKRSSQYVGYRLKNPRKGAKRYQLVLAQRKEGLYISVPRKVLEQYLLTISYWVDIKEADEVGWYTVGLIWVLPSKKDIFLRKLHPTYWNLLQAEDKTEGDIYLNRCWNSGWGSSIIPDSEIIPRNEFRVYALSDSDSYLVLNEDKLFPYTWQASITSSEALEEFIDYFAKILMENQ